MSRTSLYNVYDGAGNVLYTAGSEIPLAEAVRQGQEPLPDGKRLAYDGTKAVLRKVGESDPEPRTPSTPAGTTGENKDAPAGESK